MIAKGRTQGSRTAQIFVAAAMIAGDLKPDHGHVKWGHQAQVGYLPSATEKTNLASMVLTLKNLVPEKAKEAARELVRMWMDSPAHRDLLIETRLAIDRRELPGLSLLRIEWLLLQNPRLPFTPERPRLPGQKHPGLGLLPDVIALFVVACDRLQLDGLLFVPSHYHTASQGRKHLRFVHPEHEALLRGLEKTLHGMHLGEATHAVASGRLTDTHTGEPFTWRAMPMVLPVTPALHTYLNEAEYQRKVEEAGPYDFRLAPGGG